MSEVVPEQFIRKEPVAKRQVLCFIYRASMLDRNIDNRRTPTRVEAFIFRFKTLLLQLRRSFNNTFVSRVPRFAKSDVLSSQKVLAESRTTLWTETEPEERFLVAGKIHNLRLAARALDGIEIRAGEVFSFWKHVGRASRFRGYVAGRELREGCIIPNIGGGLCQISNALYDAALHADLEIVERHAHTQVIAGSLAEKGRDATVFWNYVDVRLRSPHAIRIEAKLDPEYLSVRFRGERKGNNKLHKLLRAVVHADQPRSCATCEMNDCHSVVIRSSDENFGKTAFLVDDVWPEFDEYVQGVRTDRDQIFLPLDGERFRKSNYAWTTNGFGTVNQSLLTTAIRSYRSRKLAAQGAARQKNLLSMYERLAASYAKRLKFDMLHLVVQQNLLPFLWKGGHLGGRTFDVLMTALPMNELQRTLDEASKLHPESTTLGDFRAEPWLAEAEAEAFHHAQKVVTPHSHIASLFVDRAKLLPWKIPSPTNHAAPQNKKPVIVFPTSTVGRKGCYELREAISGLDIKLIKLGPDIESTNFWNGFDTECGSDDWLNRADLVVLPAHVEHRPRRLLTAAAHGIPVIATANCGVGRMPGVQVIEPGDPSSLCAAIVKTLQIAS